MPISKRASHASPTSWRATPEKPDHSLVVIELTVSGELVEWRGPAPFHFIRIEGALAVEIRDVDREVTYGWGMIPVEVRLADDVFTTSLWPRHGGYMLPVKDAVRKVANLALGDPVKVTLEVVSRR